MKNTNVLSVNHIGLSQALYKFGNPFTYDPLIINDVVASLEWEIKGVD